MKPTAPPQCEWCEDRATWKWEVPQEPSYVRYGCQKHAVKVEHLAFLDLGVRQPVMKLENS